MMAKNFPKIMKDSKPQIKENQKTQKRMNSKNKTHKKQTAPSHIHIQTDTRI